MNIKGLSNERRDKLEDSLLYAQFNRDVAEVDKNSNWMIFN